MFGKKAFAAASFLLFLLFTVAPPFLEAGSSFVGPPQPSDEEVFKLLKEAGGKEDYPTHHLLVVQHLSDVTVEESGLSHTIERRIIKVLDEKGIKEASVFRFNYDPATQYMEVRWAKIYRGDGSITQVDVASSVRDLPQPLHRIFWPARMKVLEVHGLSPGDAVAFETYKKGFQIAYLLKQDVAEGGKLPSTQGGEGVVEDEGEEKYIPPMRGHHYDIFLFEETIPVKEKRYQLHIPRHKPLNWKIYNGEAASNHSFDDKTAHFSWWKQDLPAVPDEKRQPDRSDFVTKLVLATLHNWKEKSVWFFGVNEPVLAYDEAIKKKAQEIIAGAKTDAEKVRRLLRWTAHNIRYSGITMGKGEGYTMHPSTMTFTDRCGVCKDMAGMLITLMRAVGYEAYPVMTMAGARIEEVPADQFNHAVVAWKKKDGSYELLDPTWAPFDTGTWSLAEGEQHYLIGTPEGEDLMKTPAYKPEENLFEIRGESEIGPGGNLSGSFSVRATGFADSRLRRAFAHQPAKENEASFYKLFSSISPLMKIKKLRKGDYSNLDSQFAIEVTYEVEGYAAASAKEIRFVVPLAHHILRQERWSPYLMLAPWKERKNPAMFWFPQLVTVKETVKLPAGFVPKEMPEEKKFDGEFVSYNFRYSEQKGNLVYEASFSIKKRFAPKESFKELEKLVDAILEAEKKEIVLVGKIGKGKGAAGPVKGEKGGKMKKEGAK